MHATLEKLNPQLSSASTLERSIEDSIIVEELQSSNDEFSRGKITLHRQALGPMSSADSRIA